MTSRNLKRSGDLFIFDLTASADGDSVASIPLLGETWEGGTVVVPGSTALKAWAQPILQAQAAVSQWAITAQNYNGITLTKSTNSGSGILAPQLQIFVERIK